MKKEAKSKEEILVKEIEKEKLEKKILPKEEQKKINKRVFANIGIAVFILIYFLFLMLGYKNIKIEAFLIDLRVFSIGILAGAIVLFEKSYKKDDDILALYGIETLMLAIATLVSIYVCIIFEEQFAFLISMISYAFCVYYVAKSIVISKKMTVQYLKSLNDIKEIVKKEEPEKVVETKKKSTTKKAQTTTATKKKTESKTKTEAAKKKEATKKTTTKDSC